MRLFSPMAVSEWHDEAHVASYLRRFGAAPPSAGHELLLELVPDSVVRVLDLGTGNGRLLELLSAARPGLEATGLDFSPIMLAKARERFDGTDVRAVFIEHDLAEPLPELGRFGAVVSSLAIHHLEHERKRSLFAEVFDRLDPGGVFANLEHVASPTPRLHLAFFAAIGEPMENEDPSDRLAPVHSQLEWLSAVGFEDVDCFWKWRELALLAGTKPT